MPAPADQNETLRTAEVIAVMCLASDLAMGFPFEHGFQATLMARRFCDLLDVDYEITNQVYFASMLMYSGCTGESALGTQIFGGEPNETMLPGLFGSGFERFAGMVRTLPPPEARGVLRSMETLRRLPHLLANAREHQTGICEVAEMLTRRLGLGPEIHGLFTFLTERWDGQSVLRRAEGADIPLAVRIVILIRDAAFQRHIGGDAHAVQMAKERAGKAFDPELCAELVGHADEIFAVGVDSPPEWSAILETEPKPWHYLEDDEIDVALGAVGDFADLVSPSFTSHSTGVAALVSRAAQVAEMGDDMVRDVARAARVQDVGRVAVDAGIWNKRSPLSRDEHEKVRLHPYHTERVLSQSGFFDPLAAMARDHHERLDGTGYHRGVTGPSLSAPARLLAAGDVFQSMIEPRPYRPALSPNEAAEVLARLADEGQLDHSMVSAVIEAAGQPVPSMERPAGMTERETEVIALLARGLQTKQIATALGISPKTADTHIQSAYRKMAVSTRAAAAVFAMEHGMVPSGELPIQD